MSTSDRILLILHLGFAIFTLGPLTAATSVTPRYIRRRDPVVVRHLNRNTRIYGVATLGVFLFGLFLGQGRDELAEIWLTVSMTLFVVALVLLLVVERDQRRAVHLLEVDAAKASSEDEPATGEEGETKDSKKETKPSKGDIAQVERGRIASFSGVVALIWVVILVLMVWNGS